MNNLSIDAHSPYLDFTDPTNSIVHVVQAVDREVL